MEAAFYPLDTVKTRLQARRHGERVRVFRGLYRGLGGNLVGVAPATALFFAAYEPLKAALASGRDGGTAAAAAWCRISRRVRSLGWSRASCACRRR